MTAHDATSGSVAGQRSDVVVGEADTTEHPVDGRRSFGDQPVVELPSGDTIPALGFGTWRLEGAEAQRLVEGAIARGLRHIDTAQMYGNEAAVGAAIRSAGVPRSELFVTTKIDNHQHEPHALVASVGESLDRLGTDHVDLLLIHWPVEIDRMAATLDTLAQVHASGQARHIGVSNFTIEQLERFAPFAPLEVLQSECHPAFQQRELRAWCVSHGWAFTAYSPLAQGEVVDDDTLQEIARRHDVTPAAVALAWLLAQEQVTTIPRTSNIDHLDDNIAALDVDLTADDLDRIAALDAGRRLVSPGFAPWS